MGTKFLTLWLLITAALITLASSCGKDKNSSKPCNSVRYSFSVTSEFAPRKEIYNLGHTIFLNSTFPKTLFDNISNQQINYSNNLGIGGNVGIGLIDSINHKFEVATDSFSLVSSKGSNSLGLNKVVNIVYNETTSMFEFEMKLIPKKKGNYVIGVSNLGCQGIRNQDCTNAGFSMFVNNSDKHFTILTNANIPGVSIDAQRIATNYCFRVQ